jgi:hypothetical protein
MLTASRLHRLIVMTDLGSGPSLADLLLGGPAGAAAEALIAWARACGELAVAMAGREAALAGLLAAHQIGPESSPAGHWLERRVAEIPAMLARLSVPAPAGLAADLTEVMTILQPGRHPVFSPGDVCPDNNLLTTDGVRFIDYESAEFHSAFLDAAYLRMPFSTCWCVFRLPDDLQRAAEAVYRDLVSQVHPDLGCDAVWQPGIRRAVAASTLHAMTYLLDRSLLADRPTIEDGRPAPTKRQLLRYRWQRLIDELKPVAGARAEFPALAALASQLLASTEHWQVPYLPAYPAFR